MQPTALLDAFLSEHPLVEWVDILMPDLNGIPRGKRMSLSTLRAGLRDGCFFSSTVYAFDVTGANVDAVGLVWDEGDADRPLALEAARLRPVPWRESTGQIIAGLRDLDGGPFFADPRQVLAGVAARFAPLGLRPCAAIELEFHLIDNEPGPDGAPQVPHNARLATRGRGTEVYAADRLDDQDAFLTLAERWCAAQGLVVKSALCEYAPGQLELNLGHTEDMLLAADEAMMLKRCIKAAARATGQRATFMAKPYADQAGNGLHIHVSLLDEGGRNAFGEVPDGEQRLRHAVRGMQALMPESMLLFAPNANSYRRLQPLSYAPTAPTWGHNNRTVAVRIPSGPAAARRLEHRVAGADANPYLALAAVLAGILHGLEAPAEPSPATIGNAYAKAEPSLPLSWDEALRAFEDARHLPSLLDSRFCRLYATCRTAERNRFHTRITPTEYEWYLNAV